MIQVEAERECVQQERRHVAALEGKLESWRRARAQALASMPSHRPGSNPEGAFGRAVNDYNTDIDTSQRPSPVAIFREIYGDSPTPAPPPPPRGAQLFCFSQHIGSVTLQIIYFHCLKKSFPDQGIQKYI